MCDKLIWCYGRCVIKQQDLFHPACCALLTLRLRQQLGDACSAVLFSWCAQWQFGCRCSAFDCALLPAGSPASVGGMYATYHGSE